MFPTGFGQPNLFFPAVNAQAVANAAALNAVAVANAQRASLLGAVPLQRVTPQAPMLVPPGMAAEDHMEAQPVWRECKTDDGKVFYYNRITKVSTWVRPDDFRGGDDPHRSSAIGSSSGWNGWKEYMTDDGRKYYHNKDTGITQWEKPEGFPTTTPLDVSQVNLPESQKPKQEETEMEKAMKATLESLPIAKREACDEDDEQSKKKRQNEIFRDLLREKYNDGKVTATCSWEQAVKWLQQDPRFRIIPKVSEKKQIFNGWKVQKQKEERDEKRLAIKKAKEDLEKWLQDNPKMKPTLKYPKACSVFAKEEVWQAVSDADRDEIFHDVMKFVVKREADKEEAMRKRNTKALAEILEGMDQITYKTTWAQAQRLLIENPKFAEDKTLQSMDKEDALIVFEEFIRNAEKEFEEERKNEEKRFKRQERKVREAFQAFLVELHKKGELTSMSLWSSLYPTISADPRFEAMLTQSGSTPLDLFKFYVEELKEQYGEDRKVIKDILLKNNSAVTPNTTYEEFQSWVSSDEKGAPVDQGNMRLIFNSFLEKADAKEKETEREEIRKKKRLESEFRNLLRGIQPAIDGNSEWSTVRPKIEKEKAFIALETEEYRVKCFEDYKTALNETCGHHHTSKKKKKEKKKKRDSDSDDEHRDKEKDRDRKRKRRDHSSDEDRHRKKKSKKRSRSHSRSADNRKSGSDSD